MKDRVLLIRSAGLVGPAMAVAGLALGSPLLGGLGLALTAAGALGFRRALHARLKRLASIVAVEPSGDALRSLAACVDQVEDRLAATDGRSSQRHAVTGLPTREPLLAVMAEDGRGTLGLIVLRDFDRLSAFDPALGEGTLLTVVDRVLRMTAGRKLVAQVDRCHLAIWFGPDLTPDQAGAELSAMRYALSDKVRNDAGVGGRDILPEIGLSHARLSEATTPQALLSRTIAALALGRQDADEAPDTVEHTIEVAEQRYLLEQDLRQAIARGEFQLQYQPLIDAGQGRVCGAEALLRWRHPERGLVSPVEFVPVIEAMGLSDEVGLWALNAACRTAAGWRTGGLNDLRVAVNVSGHQLARGDLHVLVERTLARHMLAADALEIELTESAATGDAERARRFFDRLRALGAKIAIDDFGTGFSSFTALRTLSFDKIKIDREFVTGVDRRRDSQAICQSIIALGRGLGIRVLAEGVETRGEYAWLRAHGCQHFQGFFFSPPLDGDAFAAFVRDRARLEPLLDTGPRASLDQIARRLIA